MTLSIFFYWADQFWLKWYRNVLYIVIVRWIVLLATNWYPARLFGACISRGAKQNRSNVYLLLAMASKIKREKTPDYPQAELCFSHMWPELGANPQRWEKDRKNELLGKTLIWLQFQEFSTSGSLFLWWCYERFILRNRLILQFKKDKFSKSGAVCIWVSV